MWVFISMQDWSLREQPAGWGRDCRKQSHPGA